MIHCQCCATLSLTVSIKCVGPTSENNWKIDFNSVKVCVLWIMGKFKINYGVWHIQCSVQVLSNEIIWYTSSIHVKLCENFLGLCIMWSLSLPTSIKLNFHFAIIYGHIRHKAHTYMYRHFIAVAVTVFHSEKGRPFFLMLLLMLGHSVHERNMIAD